MRATRKQRRRLAGGAFIVVVLGSAGVAYLASNTVPVTFAGVTTVAITPSPVPTPAATAMSAEDKNAQLNLAQEAGHTYYKFQHVAATLTSGGRGVADQQVTFTAAGGTICRATTDGDGTASCPNDTKVDTSSFTAEPTTYTATFAGSDHYQGATATGSFTTVGNG